MKNGTQVAPPSRKPTRNPGKRSKMPWLNIAAACTMIPKGCPRACTG